MKTPDLTPAQLISGLGAVLSALVVLFKLNLTGEQQAALLTVIGTIVPVAWQLSDAIVRHGRAGVVAAQHQQAAAEITAAAATAHLDAVQTPQSITVSSPPATA